MKERENGSGRRSEEGGRGEEGGKDRGLEGRRAGGREGGREAGEVRRLKKEEDWRKRWVGT